MPCMHTYMHGQLPILITSVLAVVCPQTALERILLFPLLYIECVVTYGIDDTRIEDLFPLPCPDIRIRTYFVPRLDPVSILHLRILYCQSDLFVTQTFTNYIYIVMILQIKAMYISNATRVTLCKQGVAERLQHVY